MDTCLVVVAVLVTFLPLTFVLVVATCFITSLQVAAFFGVTRVLALTVHPPETDHVTFAPTVGLINLLSGEREPRLTCIVSTFVVAGAAFPASDRGVEDAPHCFRSTTMQMTREAMAPVPLMRYLVLDASQNVKVAVPVGPVVVCVELAQPIARTPVPREKAFVFSQPNEFLAPSERSPPVSMVPQTLSATASKPFTG